MNVYSCQITYEEQPVSNEVTRLYNIKDTLVQLTALTPKDLPTRMLKMTNETGELAGAIDVLLGNAGTKYRNEKDPVNHVLEEIVDVQLVISSLLIQFIRDHNIPVSAVMDMAEKKMAKWAAVLELDHAPTDN